MLEIPAELWQYIASFIPKDELLRSRLIGVNIHFYNLVLDLRYSTILVEDACVDRFLHRLRDPLVARRVRRIAIRPKTGSAKESSPPPFWRKFYPTAWKQQRPPASLEDVVDSLIPIFKLGGLTNLTSFKIESFNLSPQYELQSFFRSAWSAFGPQLKAISLAGRPETFRQFVASEPQLDSCAALSLHFSQELDAMAATVDGTLLAPFINSLAPQLRDLEMWSWSTFDLSSLFLNLGQFPQLHYFHLRTPFNKAFSNATGLTTFLEANSATLDKVELRLNPAGSGADPNLERLLAQWFSSHQANPSVLANLKVLRMYPTTLSTGFDALVMYMERSANTLTTLSVKDRYFNLDEVATLIAPVSHRAADQGLEVLRLHVRVWNADLFQLLASKLPGLKSLSLYVGGSHPHREQTERFFAEMQTHSFVSWRLRDIGVWQGGSEIPSGIMKLLATCIPSVQSFWGNGHMLGDSKIYA
ncbi:hypothetical protein C8R45DRAFT_962693 [Mycena sanguinolenta]|nr:hypothetical protein C8R45DRAFT_962693 [Mycena sanguinolenta]